VGTSLKFVVKKTLDKEIVSHILPAGLLAHFSIKEVLLLGEVSSKEMFLEICLEENNEILGDIEKSLYESKGFTEIVLQDFPIRGKAVYLRIRRRRWRLKTDAKQVIRNDFSFVAEGSGFTKELSDFLKESGQYKGRYDHEHQ
jgi:hypothetical protein